MSGPVVADCDMLKTPQRNPGLLAEVRNHLDLRHLAQDRGETVAPICAVDDRGPVLRPVWLHQALADRPSTAKSEPRQMAAVTPNTYVTVAVAREVPLSNGPLRARETAPCPTPPTPSDNSSGPESSTNAPNWSQPGTHGAIPPLPAKTSARPMAKALYE